MISTRNNHACLMSGDSSLGASQRNIGTTGPVEKEQRPRLLVAIASYGNKNLDLLKRIIRRYQNMPMDVDVVVFSEAAKDLGPDVKVIVGLPSRNPFSLPFAHKTHFAQNVERYDLFIYSEDDMEVTEKNIQAFLRVTPQLKSDEIAGYLRYELDQTKTMSLPDVHGAFHWKAESVRRRGADTITEFTNEHAGFYILTQGQLRQAIASGGFLVDPSDGRYGMLETAATDPYTCCGFRKVICISGVEDFFIHHLSDRYAGRVGLPLSMFEEQIKTLTDICNDKHPASNLFNLESKILHGRWSKSYYEKPSEELLEMVPVNAKTVLSIGCGWGATETVLKQRGAKVTALPLDSVIGVAIARLGVEVIYGSWEECQGKLEGRKFDCILMTDLLHLLPNPGELLQQSVRFIEKGGTLVVGGPNFGRIPTLIKRTIGWGDYRKLRNFVESGIKVCEPVTLGKNIKNIGMRAVNVRWFSRTQPGGESGSVRKALGRLWADSWILKAQS
jgi:2-polyprenyl-3-methyl-5-hydroxy-6-metoxy-1,4-benzoquinol methylase